MVVSSAREQAELLVLVDDDLARRDVSSTRASRTSTPATISHPAQRQRGESNRPSGAVRKMKPSNADRPAVHR